MENRVKPSTELLRAMIVDVIEANIAEYKEGGNTGFTAYGICLTLRQLNQGYEIINGDVGPVVYDIMTTTHVDEWTSLMKTAQDGRLATHWVMKKDVTGPKWNTPLEETEEIDFDDYDDEDDEDWYEDDDDYGYGEKEGTDSSVSETIPTKKQAEELMDESIAIIKKMQKLLGMD